MFKAFLIKYGEIGIKGKNRYLFEDALVAQIRHALKRVDAQFKVSKQTADKYYKNMIGMQTGASYFMDQKK